MATNDLSQGKIAHTYPGIINSSGCLQQNEVNLHTFTAPVVIPTEKVKAGILLENILNRLDGKNDYFVSPDLEQIPSHPYAPNGKEDEFEHATETFKLEPRAGVTKLEKSVNEWMFNNSEFVAQLVSQGWMYFPKPQAFDEKDSLVKDFKLSKDPSDFRTSGWYKAPRSLNQILHILQRHDDVHEKLVSLREGLEEIHFAIGKEPLDEAMRIYRTNGSYDDPKFLVKVPFGGTTPDDRHVFIPFHIEGIDDYYSRHEDKPRVMKKAIFDVSYSNNFFDSGRPTWWTRETSSVISELTREYVESNKIQACQVSDLDDCLRITIGDRYNSEPIPTSDIISNIKSVSKYALDAVSLEHEEHKSVYSARLSQRQDSLRQRLAQQ